MSLFVGLFVGLFKTDTVEISSIKNLNPYESISCMVRPAEFESATPWFVATSTIQYLCTFQAILSHKIPHIPSSINAGLNYFCRTLFTDGE